mgnify:CR=1 FL=1
MTARDSRTPLYGIAVAAQLVDLPEATIRLFESKGLLAPARSDGGTRRYSDDDITRLRRAAALRGDGINIAGIARVLDLQDENADLREALDAAGFTDTIVLAYAAKYASAAFGPFREAVDSALKGDRATYQQDPANLTESLREVELDLEEGADMVMVKPATLYLDVIAKVAPNVDVPLAAYHVSGEMAMIEAAAANGWIDRERMIRETLTSIKRAGASIVLTYYALEFARGL